jgi:hypothetical protein
MKYRPGGIRIYGGNGPLWVIVGWNMWWLGVSADWRKRPILMLNLGRVLHDISRSRA